VENILWSLRVEQCFLQFSRSIFSSTRTVNHRKRSVNRAPILLFNRAHIFNMGAKKRIEHDARLSHSIGKRIFYISFTKINEGRKTKLQPVPHVWCTEFGGEVLISWWLRHVELWYCVSITCKHPSALAKLPILQTWPLSRCEEKCIWSAKTLLGNGMAAYRSVCWCHGQQHSDNYIAADCTRSLDLKKSNRAIADIMLIGK